MILPYFERYFHQEKIFDHQATGGQEKGEHSVRNQILGREFGVSSSAAKFQINDFEAMF